MASVSRHHFGRICLEASVSAMASARASRRLSLAAFSTHARAMADSPLPLRAIHARSHRAPRSLADAPQSAGRTLPARVDPRVELFAIVFRLAGNPEYNDPASASPYAEAIETWFGPFREHPAVVTAARLRAERGVGYDA